MYQFNIKTANWFRRNPLGLAVIVLALVVIFETTTLLNRTQVTRKSTQTSQSQTVSESKTSQQASASQSGQFLAQAQTSTSAESHANTNSRVRTSKTTTTWDPITGNPTSTTEEHSWTDNETHQTTGQNTSTNTTSTGTTNTQTNTNTQTQTNTTNTNTNTTTNETTVKAAGPKNSPLGIAATTSGRLALTYDVVKVSKVSLAGLVELDPRRKNISGVGAGINADIAKDGRYFAGVYGKYDFEAKGTQVIGVVGMRF